MLVNTIEDNYKLPIDDIVCVDLYAFRDVLDALGGVEMESTEEYAMQMNIILAAEQNALFGADDVIDICDAVGMTFPNGMVIPKDSEKHGTVIITLT